MNDIRIETDSMGQVSVPSNALYGAQTQRAIDNFPISGKPMPEEFIRALLLIKQAAAQANKELDVISSEIADAISQACKNLLNDPELMLHFPVDIYQTGSGTSSNMNANEVLATLAKQICGKDVSPNDHVNAGQSSNDVIPTAIHVSAALAIENKLLPALKHLNESTRKKADTLSEFVKTGRTHLMDAMPVRMSQSVGTWADQISDHIERLSNLQKDLKTLAQGGTAVGTGINAAPNFSACFCKHLSEISSINFSPAKSFFTHIGSQDIAVSVSGQLKAIAISMIKISNDLRWMNSGPLAGLAEIELQALQPGSSIMPGKVNPVIPEACVMASMQVMGNDLAISLGGQSSNFELNVTLPLIAKNLIESISLLENSSRLLADKAISTFKVNTQAIEEALARNPILVTALNPIIGYLKAAEIAKKAYASGKPIIDVALEETDLKKEELEEILDPYKLTS